MSHIGGDWYQDTDAASGAPYYTNYSTGEVTWEYPSDLPSTGGEGEWVKTLDEASGTYYYLNSLTGESRWENPNTESGSEKKDSSTTAAAVSGSSLSPEDDPANWTSGVDESSGYTYYYNAVTQVNQWEAPACLSGDCVTNTTTTAPGTEEPKEIVDNSVDEMKASVVPPPPAPKKATVVPPPAPKKATVVPPLAPKKATVVPPPAPKKATVVPPPAPQSPSKSASVVPPPAPPTKAIVSPPVPPQKKSSIVAPLPSSPTKKKVSLSLPPPTSTDIEEVTIEDIHEDLNSDANASKSYQPPAPDTDTDTEGVDKGRASSSSSSSEDVPTEGIKTLGLRGKGVSKQASFAALRALDTTTENENEEGESDTETSDRFQKPSIFRDTSMIMTAPVESAFGHRQSTIQMLPSKGDATTHSLCEEVFDVTFQQYGEKNYNFERKGLFKGRTTIEKMTTWKSDLIKTSLRILSPELSSEAVQVFKNVTGYMGDRASSKSPIDHLIKILNQMMLAPEELRDELYCQLCKQTNGNPNPESTESGWQLFMVALATFPPSFDLKPHLMAYFVDNLTHEIPNCAKYAEICLHRCPKICKLGARRELPTRLELETIRRGGVITVRVFFLDGKYATLKADSWTTVRELEESVASLLKIQNSEPFSLCEVSNTEEERVPDPDERILDIISFWDRTANEAFAKGNFSEL